MILNDSPFNFSCIIKQVIDIFQAYQIGCDFGGDINCALDKCKCLI